MSESVNYRALLEPKHFRIEQLGDGIFAAINRPDGWAIGNAGIVDIGDSTLVFDATLTPASAGELRAVAEYLTNKPISYVINSHYHNDHTWGNMQFIPSSLIISSTKTRQEMLDKGKDEFRYYKKNAAKQKARIQAEFERCKDEQSRTALHRWFTYHLALQKNMRKIRRFVPTMTFQDHLCLCGSERHIELIAFENGHTSSDVILYLPEEKIVFMADLLSVEFHPYLEECQPKALIGILNEIAGFGAKTYVPGHGEIGYPRDLACMEDYVSTMKQLASQLSSSRISRAKIEEVDIPEQFKEWDFRQIFYSNLASFARRQNGDS